ncbi:MAG: hypothetical protein J6V80_02260 [Clostridia bacterium]|nr:hypothetical protein [Clostridia bacterium]
MKKLLALLVIISCLLLSVSCTPTTPEIPVSEGGVSFAEFVSAATATSSPKASVIETERQSDKGTLTAKIEISYNTDGSSVIEYTYDRFGSISLGEDFIVTESETVSCDKNGNYSDGGAFTGNVIASGAYSLNLVESKLRDARIEGNILYATVFSYDTAAVLGVNLGTTVLITVTVNNGKIDLVSATYNKGADKISVECEYAY